MSDCSARQAAVEAKAQELGVNLHKTIEALNAQVGDEADDIAPDINKNNPTVALGIDFDVTWEDISLSLDLPEVKLVDQKMALDLPQITMKDQKIIFDLPSVRMETRKTGEYPEFYCDTSSFIPKCTVRWSPIYMDVPVPFMERHEIVLGLPEFRMDRTEFVMGVPEFAMRSQKIVLRLPQITVKKVSDEAAKAQEKGRLLAASAKARADGAVATFRENAKIELGGHLADLFDCYRETLVTQRNAAAATFGGVLDGLKNALVTMTSAKVPADNPQLIELQTQISAATAKRDATLGEFDHRLADLDNAQKEAVERLMVTTSH